MDELIKHLTGIGDAGIPESEKFGVEIMEEQKFRVLDSRISKLSHEIPSFLSGEGMFIVAAPSGYAEASAEEFSGGYQERV